MSRRFLTSKVSNLLSYIQINMETISEYIKHEQDYLEHLEFNLKNLNSRWFKNSVITQEIKHLKLHIKLKKNLIQELQKEVNNGTA